MNMDVQTVVANTLTLNTDNFVIPALQGLSDADLLKRPSDQCNPIGWLLWHQTRTEDAILSLIGGRPQTWVADNWHAAIPDEPPSLVTTVSAELAFRKHRCENTP